MTTELKQKTWLLHLGFIQPNKEWYADQEEETQHRIIGTTRKQNGRAAASLKSLRKMIKGIYVLAKNRNIETRSEVYEILKERGFIPIVHGEKSMSEARFKFYWCNIIRDKFDGRKTQKISNTERIQKLYGTKSPEKIALELGISKKYTLEVINKLKHRGIIS